MIRNEHNTVKTIITLALAHDWVISVHDGEEWAVKRSDDVNAIFEAATAVDECRLRLVSKTAFINKAGQAGNIVGNLYLVFGNDPSGEELIADYTANAETEAFVREVERAMRW